MTYMILGRAIKNEYLSLAVLGTAFGGAWLATRGGAAKVPASVGAAQRSVRIDAGSAEEAEFIRKFIKEAEEKEVATSH